MWPISLMKSAIYFLCLLLQGVVVWSLCCNIMALHGFAECQVVWGALCSYLIALKPFIRFSCIFTNIGTELST